MNHGLNLPVKPCWTATSEMISQRLIRAVLDAACRENVDSVGTIDKVKAGLTPLAMLLATVGGVMMIPIDFGHSVIASAFYRRAAWCRRHRRAGRPVGWSK